MMQSQKSERSSVNSNGHSASASQKAAMASRVKWLCAFKKRYKASFTLS